MKIILIMLLCAALESCRADENFFYEGLRLKTESAALEQAEKAKRLNEARARFEKSLDSANKYIRAAAAVEIFELLYEGQEIPARVLARAKKEAVSSWAAAFDALNSPAEQRREKALVLLLGAGNFENKNGAPVFSETFPDAAALYTLRECLARDPAIFSPAETAAINGHFSALRSRFADALAQFRVTLDLPPGGEGGAEDAVPKPEIFFRYPDLLNSLGRAFQYAGTDSEGIELFTEWEKSAARNTSGDIRFRLLFFAGRIARQRGFLEQGITLFETALPFAPDSEQSDACVWYILDSVLDRDIDRVPEKMAALMPRWHDKAYFNDVLDTYISRLAARSRWAEIAAFFPLVRDYADSASIAKCAYIISRALDDQLLLAEAAGGGGAREYLEMSYNADNSPSYYRAKSAAALEKPFLKLPPPARQTRQNESDALEFLRGFFSHGAAAFAPAYINALENDLTPACKRAIAKELNGAGLYADSIRLIAAVLENGGNEPAREDLELYFPRPFKDLIEKYACEYNIAPELLFGLVRTESAFQSAIISHAGAVGLTQLMPTTAAETAERIRRQGGSDYTPVDAAALRHSEVNIHIGAAYLRYLLDRAESPLLALLSYNGGMNRVRRWRSRAGQTPAALHEDLFLETIEYRETREYGRKVIAASRVYWILYYNEEQ